MTETANGDVVLSAQGVYKKFGRNMASSRRQLGERISAVVRGQSAQHKKMKPGDFWSLRDINLEVRRGEVLGIIGLNGAGKSTLLRVLYGLMPPDLGAVEVFGEMGALIELGAGFEASLSGRQNIMIKGALMGRSREEMEAAFEEIHEFSELGEFINSPVSSYSSGMRLRLAFAIASTITPDLLLLDEIVSVGDFTFKQKCRSRLNEMTDRAGVVFASHSMGDIRSMCSKAIVLQKGQIAFRGDPNSAIDFYTEVQADIEAKRINKPKAAVPVTAEPTNDHGQQATTSASVDEAPPADADVEIIKDTRFGVVALNPEKVKRADHYWSSHGAPTNVLNSNDEAVFHFDIEFHDVQDRLEIGILIWDERGNKVAPIEVDAEQSDFLEKERLSIKGHASLEHFLLMPGRYVTSFTVSRRGIILYRNILDEISVVSSDKPVGVVRLPASWRVDATSDAS